MNTARSRDVAATIETCLRDLADSIAKIRAADDWVTQHDSPLGKRAHLALVRSGKLRGFKHGKLVLVKRSDLDAYIESHPAKLRDVTLPEDDEAAIAAVMNFKAPRRRRTG